MACITITSPVGPLCLTAQDGRIRSIEFRAGSASEPIGASDLSVLNLAASQLERYFAGELTRFSVPLELKGPDFHMRVWDVLASIPFGETMTYAQIAERLGSPKAARAVGNACAKNPIVVVIPCHRVLAQNGLGGFGGGLPAKRWLLTHEGFTLPPSFR